jgi:hypothetical protein
MKMQEDNCLIDEPSPLVTQGCADVDQAYSTGEKRGVVEKSEM